MAIVQGYIAPRRPQLPALITVPPAAAHPKIVQLYEYWHKVATPGGGLPSRKNIDPTEIPTLLDHVWMLDVVGEPRRFRFRLLGGAAERRNPPARAGDFIDQFFENGATDERLDDLHFVATAGRPVWFRGPPRLKHKSEIAELERIHLPLAADGVTVNMILCLTVYYSFVGKEI
jgi:hypothetical protein